MKISKRSLIMALSMMLALTMTAFGTIAYMTDRDAATNTFTIGSIDIVVDEENVDGVPGIPDDDGDGNPDFDLDEDGKPDIEFQPNPEDPTLPPVLVPEGKDPVQPGDKDEDGNPDYDIDGDGVPDIELRPDPDDEDKIIIDPTPDNPDDTDKDIVFDTDPDTDVPERDNENDYDLIPGKVHTKDPTITVLANSEECYVRFRLSINMVDTLKGIMDARGMSINSPEAFLAEMVNIDDQNWQFMGVEDVADGSTEFEFWHMLPNAEDAEKINAGTEDYVVPALFTTFTVPTYFTGDDVKHLGNLTVVANGDAIQTASFNNATEAWAAFDKQVFDKEDETE